MYCAPAITILRVTSAHRPTIRVPSPSGAARCGRDGGRIAGTASRNPAGFQSSNRGRHRNGGSREKRIESMPSPEIRSWEIGLPISFGAAAQ